ncbi:MAG: hypothetical protein H0S85_06800 [Desulfovibrionaceae bacterium]|jgi:hypothetical protein|nr:hypothetical protein [Desulfovibrionaceae bacterium]
MRNRFILWSILFLLLMGLPIGVPAAAAGHDVHGLPPADDMVFLPHLPGLRNKALRNDNGQKRMLSEAVALRGSSVQDGKASVPPGGFFYLSEVSGDAAPFAGDPFLLLGEQAYLVDLETGSHETKGLSVKLRQKAPVDDTGYRVWFDYATDHYEKPYGEIALIAPSGGWPLEMPVSSAFEGRDQARALQVGEGFVPQIKHFFLDREYLYGATRVVTRHLDFDRVDFESIRFPVIRSATFSMTRPVILDIRQEDYRYYFNKRIYAFRRPDGFLVRVTDFFGDVVLAEKLVRPATAQGYKTMASERDQYQLTIPELDMRIEIKIEPALARNSDFAPWAASKAHGFGEGTLRLVVWRNLVTVRQGEPWPLDPRYVVGLEPNLMTGMLQRLVLENAEPFSLDNETGSIAGPVKWSDWWFNRPAFTLTAGDLDGPACHNLYLRDYYLVRTDNMVFWPKEGRRNIDFFVGLSPVLEPILESTFLSRLADPSFGTVVEGSHFSSYPKAISDGSFYEPDHSAPFVPRFPGLKRKIYRNGKGERLLAAESVFIRGSYVDYRNGRIVIPPAGLCYSSRNARNVRPLAEESFHLLGKRAYLVGFDSSTFVRKNFQLDFWKNQPMGDDNLMYWQDQLLGVRNKALRFTGHHYLDDRPEAELSLMKYSGNRWGSHFFMAQGLAPDAGNRYRMPEVFAEGATWIVPEFIGTQFVRIKEFGTPTINSISFTYDKPADCAMAAGEEVPLGGYVVRCERTEAAAGAVTLSLLDREGKVLASKELALTPERARLLPQDRDAVRALQLAYADVVVELDPRQPFSAGKANLHAYTGVQLLERDTPFEFDPRFMVRPDVCGHCYQFNELLLDNPEAIVLDRAHPTYDGPKGEDGQPLFRIVIDSFDGEMIHAWHMETTEDGETRRSENLAFQPRDNLDVLLGVTGTTEGFLRLSMLPRLAFMEQWRTWSRGGYAKLSGAVNTGGSAHIRR